MPETFIGGAVCRELESEAPAAETVSYAAANSSVFRRALKVAMVAELFLTEDKRVPDSYKCLSDVCFDSA